MSQATDRWAPPQRRAHAAGPSGQSKGAPRVSAALRYLYQCQLRGTDQPVYIEDLARALHISGAEALGCVEELRDRGLAISTGADAEDPCVCLSLKGLSQAIAADRRRKAG